jgi:MtN3 and saliva related transmembrane protein
MSPIQLLGLCAATFTTVSFLPQAARTIRTRDTTGISLWMYVIFCTGVLLWLVYGLLRHDLPIITANAITLATAGTVLLLKVRSG